MLRVEQGTKRQALLDTFAARRSHLKAIVDNPFASEYERDAAASEIALIDAQEAVALAELEPAFAPSGSRLWRTTRRAADELADLDARQSK